MHGNADESCPAERREGTHAMCDGVATEGNFGVAIAVEQPANRIANTVERSGGHVGSRDDEQRALRARGAGIDTATATVRVRDSQLRHLGTKQREHRVRVVAGVFVDREDLEPETETAEVLGGAADRNADRLFVIPKRQDDRDVEPRAVCHRREK